MIRARLILIVRLMIIVAISGALSSCVSLISLEGPPIGENPYLVDASFPDDVLKNEMGVFRQEIGFPLAVGSIAGVVNGYADVSELSSLEEVGSLGRHKPVRRALHMYEQAPPLLYSRSYNPVMDAELRSYHVPLVQSATFAPLENDFKVPERTHLGLTYISVGAVGGHDVIPMLDFAEIDLRSDGSIRGAGTTVVGVETYMHPGVDRFAVPMDNFISYPRLTSTTLERRGFESELQSVPVQTIRRQLLPVEQNGRVLSYRTLFEGYVLGEHNVYLALLLDSTESGAGKDRSSADYTGTVGAVFLVYDTEEALRTALEGAVDQEGYNVLTGFNAAGFNRQGRTEDGRRFDGRVTRVGRSGMGTTVYPDGREVTGRYVADELTGLAVETAANGSRTYGYWEGNQKNGEYLRVSPGGQEKQIVEYRADTAVSADTYVDSFNEPGWLWLADIVPETEADALSVDGKERLRLLEDGAVLIEDIEGHLYVGPFARDRRVSGVLNYADGSYYSGEMVNRIPDGKGRLTTPDGIIIDGGFANGQPDGLMARTEGERVTEVRYTGGNSEMVDDQEAAEVEEGPASLEDYIRSATRQHREFVSSVRQERVDRALAIAEATVSLTLQAAEALADAMEAYNQEVARQQEATAQAQAQASSQPTGPARGRAWSSGIPDAAPGGQLSYLVEGAEHYYQEYLAAHGRGDIAAARELYRGHELTVRNAEQLERQL